MDTIYVDEIEDDDDIYTVQEFREAVEGGGFIDYDGFGTPAKDGKKADHPDHWIRPSLMNIPPDATHVVWYNR